MSSPGSERPILDSFAVGAGTTAVWSVVNLSESQESLRLDAEYYQPGYLRHASSVAEGERLEEIAHTSHPAEIRRVYAPRGLQILLAQNIRPNRLDFSKTAYMARSVRDRIVRNRLHIDDVVVTRSGANYGDSAVYKGSPSEVYACADCLIVRPRRVPGGYLSTYLNTTIGRALLTRGAYGMAQPHISRRYLDSLRLPRFGDEFEQEIDRSIEQAFEMEERSAGLYATAEAELLSGLGLDAFDAGERLTYTANLSDAWSAGRLDAEYFRPRYDMLLRKLDETGEAVTLGRWLAQPVRRGVQPDYSEDGDVVVINSRHVAKTQVEVEANRTTSLAFAQRNERAVLSKYDVLLNSTGRVTIGRCHSFLADVPAIADSHISIIRPRGGIDPVYLAVFLNSLPGQMQTERSWTGSSGQIELTAKCIAKYRVWRPDDAFQRRVRELVEQSYAARQQARRLLDDARRRVEAMVLRLEE